MVPLLRHAFCSCAKNEGLNSRTVSVCNYLELSFLFNQLSTLNGKYEKASIFIIDPWGNTKKNDKVRTSNFL